MTCEICQKEIPPEEDMCVEHDGRDVLACHECGIAPPVPKFVITHANHNGVRHIVRLPEGWQMIPQSINSDTFQALCVGWIHMVGSHYCVHLDAPGIPMGATFARQMLRDVRSELSRRDPQYRSTPNI